LTGVAARRAGTPLPAPPVRRSNSLCNQVDFLVTFRVAVLLRSRAAGFFTFFFRVGFSLERVGSTARRAPSTSD
jgi:hypothetical protein